MPTTCRVCALPERSANNDNLPRTLVMGFARAGLVGGSWIVNQVNNQETTGPDIRAVVSLFRGGPLEPQGATAVACDWRGQRTYLVRQEPEEATTLLSQTSLEQKPVSDGRTLRDFLVEATQQYPSQHYALAVAGHANREHVVVDDNGEGMTAQDFARALREARQLTGKGLSVVLFEGCEVTQQPGVVATITEQSEYVLGSPTPIETGRIPWGELLAKLKEPDLVVDELARDWRELTGREVPTMNLYPSVHGES